MDSQNIVAGTTLKNSNESGVTTDQKTVMATTEFVEDKEANYIDIATARTKETSQAFHADANLSNFLSRPILLETFDWTVGNELDDTWDPWNAFLQNVPVQNKLKNYQLLRMNLKMRFVISASPFHYSKALITYEPFPNKNRGGSISVPGLSRELMILSQLPHTFIDAMDEKSAEISIPFFRPSNWLSICPNFTQPSLGEVRLRSLAQLRVATADAQTTIKISVFIWAEDVELTMPTAQVAIQMDEYKPDGLISAPLTTLATMAGALSKVPNIGSYATATQTIAKAGASAAAMFGYSRQSVVTDPEIVKNTPFSSLAHTNGNETAVKLTFDPKQEQTIDSKVTGIVEQGDNLAVAAIVGRPTIIYHRTWAQASTKGTSLISCSVTPVYAFNDAVGATDSRSLYQSSLSFGTLPFKYWSGTIKYRLFIIASKFHRGKLKLTYEPNGAELKENEYNTAYTHIIDLEETRDYEFDISWASYRPYLQVPPPTETYIDGNDGSVSYFATGCNGKFYISIINPLVGPVGSSSAEVVMWASAGADYEVFCPAGQFDSNFYFGTLTSGTRQEVPPALVTIPEDEKEEPKVTLEMDAYYGDMPGEIVASKHLVGQPSTDMLGEKSAVFAGEKIASFRAYMKRYMLVDIIRQPLVPGTGEHSGIYTYEAQRAVRPPWGLYPANNQGYHLDVIPISQPLVNYCHTSLITYISSGFAGTRGGYKYKFAPYTTVADLQNLNVSRGRTHPLGDSPNTWEVSFISDAAGFDIPQNRNISDILGTAWTGTQMTDCRTQSSLEVKFPYYSKDKFIITSSDSQVEGIDEGCSDEFMYNVAMNASILYTVNAHPSLGVLAYCSIADDFQAIWYLGAPPLFYDVEPV